MEVDKETSSKSQGLHPAASPPWREMFRSASLRPTTSEPSSLPPKSHDHPSSTSTSHHLVVDAPARLAVYIAMAHAGLALCLLTLYGLYLLLSDFLRPILWAILCSIPLREVQDAVVSFWDPPLKQGLVATILALPSAAFQSSAMTLADARAAILRRPLPPSPSFPRLLRWLLSSYLFLHFSSHFGLVFSLFIVVFLSVFINPNYFLPGRLFSKSKASPSQTLKTIVAVGLMLGMILGLLAGGAFFSYKIGVEGRDVVMTLKSHVQNNNYAERIGFKKFMDDNDIPGLVDKYSGMVYETVWDQIDQLADAYNLTDFTNGFRHFLISQSAVPSAVSPADSIQNGSTVLISSKLQDITTSIKNREWAEIYRGLDSFFRELLVTRVDLVEKAKELALQGTEILKQVLSSGTTVLGGSANLVFSITLRIVSGAAEVLNFVSQLMVFLWVLYYLITAESGGATEQAIGMLPISKRVKDRCVEVIDHAISSVLLATAKIAIFQGCLTWLLFRFFGVHFVYTSTVLALISPLVPILPPWLSSLFAAGQLLLEGRYVLAAIVTASHLILMDYGTQVIQEEIPGYNAYLTGLSIIGGVTLLSNALEGAIMGPLILTLVIALKNLYSEFVLGDTKGTHDD
ncbi:Transmembrane protein 245 [Rhynchospora pubera]|uniref:Transmembrane protein 245 n=1 Tax=Rhynchospora pubera TaxID=906938 RepID=A0AAV8CEC9_9POAL|nr:Transmembrane protein 245 [Rhynchospora pubera]